MKKTKEISQEVNYFLQGCSNEQLQELKQSLEKIKTKNDALLFKNDENIVIREHCKRVIEGIKTPFGSPIKESALQRAKKIV